MAKIMIVDDEESMVKLLERIVVGDGYECCIAKDGFEALEVYENERPDLLILDVMLPKMNGFQTCRKLRAAGALIPIIFLSAKSDIADKGAGFGAGGDDYLVKPFSSQELSLRIEAHLNNYERLAGKQGQDSEALVLGDFSFDSQKHEVTVRGTSVSLTPKEYQLLYLMASHPESVFTREQLMAAVWGKEYIDDISSVPVYVRRIREKIEVDPSNPQHLQTIWRVGYRFCA